MLNFLSLIKEKIDLVVQGFKSDRPLFSSETSIDNYYCTNYCGNIQDGIMELYHNYLLGFLWIKLFNNLIIERFNLRFNDKFNVREDDDFVLRYLKYCNKINIVDKIGYFYNVPNWKNKYSNSSNMFELHKSLYESSLIIYEDNFNELISYHFNELTDEFLELLKKTPWMYKRGLVQKYRNIAIKNIFKSRLNFISQFIIYIDCLGYFSVLFLSFYLQIKDWYIIIKIK